MAEPSAPTPDDGSDADAVARLALGRAREVARGRGLRRSARRGPDRSGDARPADGGAEVEPAPGAPVPWKPGPGLGDGISGPGPSRRDPQPLAGVAEHLVLQHGWRRAMSVGGVVGRWREVVGDQLADHCQVETFDGGELVLRASSTAWATQVRLLMPQLERRLAEEVGEGTVTSIVVLGPGGPSWKHGRRSVRGRGPRDTYG